MTKISLKANDGNFVTATNFASGPLQTQEMSTPDQFAKFDLTLSQSPAEGGAIIQLLAANGINVGVPTSQGALLEANSAAPEATTTFRVIWRGINRIALQSMATEEPISGLFVTSSFDGGNTLRVTSSRITEKEEFQIVLEQTS